jgi:hypothetical protein
MVWSNVKMYLHGAILAAGTAFTMSVEQVLSSGVMPTTGQLKTDGITALSVGILYLLKIIFMGSSNQPSPPAAGTGAKLIVLLALVSMLTSCAAFKTIKWSGNCTNTGCNICANIDSVKFNSMTETQLLNVVKSALSDSLVSNLEMTYGLSNLGSIGWSFTYSNGNVCIGASVVINTLKSTAPQQIPITKTDKQKAVVNGMWKSLHR